MSKRFLTCLTAFLIGVVLCPAALAGRGSLALRCIGEVNDPGPTAPLAMMAEGESSISTELYDSGLATAQDGESFQCSFIVPADYDDTGDPPEIHFYGWAPGGLFAGLVACTEPNEMQWDIYWRSYHDANSVFLSETQTEATDTETLSCVACSGHYCFTPEVFNDFSGEIVADADDWSPGELVVVRPQRQTGGNNFELKYQVWLAGVEIEYPN